MQNTNIYTKNINCTKCLQNKDRSIYYYAILFAILLYIFGFIPIVIKIIENKSTEIIPYLSIYLFLLSFLIFLFIAIYKKYYIHLFFYTIGLTSVSIILFLKYKYNQIS